MSFLFVKIELFGYAVGKSYRNSISYLSVHGGVRSEKSEIEGERLDCGKFPASHSPLAIVVWKHDNSALGVPPCCDGRSRRIRIGFSLPDVDGLFDFVF